MPLVEVIPSLLTEKNISRKNLQPHERMGKTPVIAKDIPGLSSTELPDLTMGKPLGLLKKTLQHLNRLMKP